MLHPQRLHSVSYKQHANMDYATLHAVVRYPEAAFPSDAADIASKLLIRDPDKRLGAHGAVEVKQHPYFRGLDWDALGRNKQPRCALPTCVLEAPGVFRAREGSTGHVTSWTGDSQQPAAKQAEVCLVWPMINSVQSVVCVRHKYTHPTPL